VSTRATSELLAATSKQMTKSRRSEKGATLLFERQHKIIDLAARLD